jgi:hypothetical protein
MTTDIFCFYLQNRLIQTSRTGGQQYSDTSPFSIESLLHHQSTSHLIQILEMQEHIFNGKEATVNRELDGSTYPS